MALAHTVFVGFVCGKALLTELATGASNLLSFTKRPLGDHELVSGGIAEACLTTTSATRLCSALLLNTRRTPRRITYGYH